MEKKTGAFCALKNFDRLKQEITKILSRKNETDEG